MSGRGISVVQLYHAWLNSILNEEDLHVANLTELQDGVALYHLIEILHPNSKDDQKFQASREKIAIQRLQAVLDLLYRNGVKISVGAHEILQGDTKALLDVLWGIILNFFIHTPERPPTQRTVRVAKRNLLDWCKQQQPDLAFNIHASLGKNFGKSDVLARIISTNCQVEESEELIEYLANAVTATEDQLGINKDILNPVDIIDGTIDEHALLVYLALVKRKSQLKGKITEHISTIPNGIPEELDSPVLLNANNSRRSPSPKATSLRNSPIPKTESPRNSPVPERVSPRNSPIPKTESPRNSPAPKAVSPRNSPIPKAASSRNSPIPKASSPRNSPIPAQRPVSPCQETNTCNEVCQSSPRYSLLNKVDLDFDDNPITFEVPSSSTPRSPLTSPRRSPVPSPNRPLSPATNVRNNRPISPRPNQENNPDSDLIIDLTKSGDNFVETSLLISPRQPVETTPQQTYSSSRQRSQSTSPNRTQPTSPRRTQSTSPQRTQSTSPPRTTSPNRAFSPPSPRRTIGPQSFNVNHVYSPRNTPLVETDNFRSRSPLGSPGTTRRQKATSPLGSPRPRSPHLTSPRINGHRGMNGFSTMDPGDRLDFNGFDEKGNGNLSDNELPNSARSGRTDTSDWLSSSSGSVHAYNVARGKDEIADSGVDTELAEAIKKKVSEHFEIDSQQNTPRIEENPDVTLTGQTTDGLGMCKSMSNDDLLTMLEAIGHQGKTLRDELISREQELMLMQVQSDDPNLGLGLVQKYEQDVEILKRENEKLAKEVASAKTAVLPEREIVNTLLSEIGVMREKMDAVETTALSPRDNNSPRLDLDSGFKESVQRLSHTMDNLDQKLGQMNQGSNCSSMDSLHDRGSLLTSSPEAKPPSGAFKHAELRWHDQEKALKEQIAAQRRKINELESMITLTKNDNKELQKKLDKASTNIANRVNDMDAMINETRNEMDAIQTENDELKEYHKKDKQTIKKLEEDIEMLEKKIGNLQRENSSLTDQLQANMKKSQALEGTRSRLEALTKENTNLKEKLAATEEEKRQLQQDCTKYIKRCREAESRESQNSSPQKTAPVQITLKSSRPDSPTKQNTTSRSSSVKQNTSATSSPVKQNTSATNSPVKQNMHVTSTSVKPNGFVTSTPVKQNVPVTSSPVKSNNGTPPVVSNGHLNNPSMVRASAMPDAASSPSVSPISSLKYNQRNVDDQRKTTSSPTKYITEKPDRNVQAHVREGSSPERPKLNPGNRYEHHERIMIQAKQAMEEAEYNPPVVEKKERPIDLAELSRKYPELDRYSHKAWPDELTRVSPEEQSFEDVVQRVSAVSKTLDSEMEKSINLYQKMQTPKVEPISRARLRSEESVRSPERGSESRRMSGDKPRGDSEHRYTPPPRRVREERPVSSKLGHRRTHSASGEKPNVSVAADEPSRYVPKQFGSLQNLSSRDRSVQHAVDHRNVANGDATASSGRPVYRASSAERLANRGPPARAHQESTTSRTAPQEPNVQTPSRSSDIRNILQKRFGSAPLPPRMSAAMRVRRSEESTPTRPSGQYSDGRPAGHRGTAPIKVVHAPTEAVYQEQYQQTPISAWDDDSNERLKDKRRSQESMPRRRMYQEEEESRPPGSEERSPVGSRHGSGLRYRDHTPNRESDRYASQEQIDVRDQRHPTTQPPVIMVTPPDEQLKEVPRARQYRRFSGSEPDTEPGRAEESETPVYARDQNSRPPSSHRRTPEMQQRNQASERQPMRPRSQTPQRSPGKQSPDSSVHERHPSSPSGLRGQGEPPTRQQDMYETGQLVNWRDVVRDYAVDVNEDYPYFGIMNNEPQVQQVKAPQYKDYDDPSGEPVVAGSEDDLMYANGVYREIPEPSPQKSVYKSHRRAASLDNRNRSSPSQNQNSYGQYHGDSGLNNNASPPSAPLKGNPHLRDSPTHRSASSISQMSSVSRTEPEPTEIPVYNTNDQPKLSAAQIAYVDSLIEKYTRT